MASWPASDLRLRWRRMNLLNDNKSETGGGSGKKMLNNDEQSRYVYENKQNYDKMPDEKSDIYVEVTGILQKIAGLERQYSMICGFGAFWGGELTANLRLRLRRAARQPSPTALALRPNAVWPYIGPRPRVPQFRIPSP